MPVLFTTLNEIPFERAAGPGDFSLPSPSGFSAGLFPPNSQLFLPPQTNHPMTMKRKPCAITLLALASLLSVPARAQTVPPAAASTATSSEAIQLSPFTVSSDSDTGYRAKESLEGSRLRISLDDISVPMDVITPEMLEDLNITRQEGLFDLVSNMEDRGDFFLSGVYESGASYRIRGFVGVTSLRNFLKGNMSFDSFNSTRFIASKGPNSILFGAGPGGGSISYFTKRYEMGSKDQATVKFSADDFGSLRGEANFTKTVIPNKLGVHVAAFNDRSKFEITPAYEHRYGQYMAVGYRPFKNTLVNASYETRTEHVYRAASNLTTIIDNYSAWLDAGSPATLTTGLGTAARGVGYSNTQFDLRYPNGSTLNRQALTNFGLTSFTTSTPRIIDGQLVDLAGSAAGTTRLASPAFANQRNFPAHIWPADRGPTGLNGGAEVRAKAIDISIEQKVTDDFYLMLAAGQIDSTRLLLTQRTRALSIDSNYYMPNRSLNPNFGKYYLETGMGTIDNLKDTKTATLTAAYELDLEKKVHKFLGKHNFALLYSDVSEVSQGIRQRMSLVKTPTNAAYQPTTAATDALTFRDYVDPSKGQTLADYRYVLKNGYEASGYRWELVDGAAGTGSWSKVDNASYMGVLQSSWLKNRIITNYGYRKEDVVQYKLNPFLNAAKGGLATFYKPYTKAQAGDVALLKSLETTDLRPTVFPTEPWETFTGVASNWGLIVKATPNIAFVGNQSKNLSPSVGRVGIFGVPLPTSEGESEDYGVRFNLFNGKLRVEYTNYKTSVTNQELQTNQLSIPEDQANDLWQMLIQARRKTTNVFQDYAGWDNRDFVSKGHEVTITTSPVRGLSARVAISYNEQVASNLGSSFMPWWRENVAEFESFAAANPTAVNTLNPTSLNAADTLQSAKNELLVRDAREGLPNINAALWAVKALAKYSFVEGRLKGNEVGVNIAWRSPMVTSYFINPNGTNNLEHPYKTEETMFTHVFWSHSRRLNIMGKPLRWRFQLNVNNLFDQHKLVERNFFNIDRTNFDSPTVSTGYFSNVGRSFAITNTFSF